MTNEEAIDVLNNTAWLGTDVGIKVYPAVKMAAEALENREKYRWHDLRKNPKDLPKLLDEVLVCAEDSYGNKEYVVATKVEQEVKQDSMVFNGWSCLGFVIAWRYIEPFEEVVV